LTFDKPTFVKPDSATVDNLEYWNIMQGGLKIGSMRKGEGKIYLSVLYNDYELKISEKNQVMSIIEMEYVKLIFHSLYSIKNSTDLDEAWEIVKTAQKKTVSKYKVVG